MSPAAAEVNSFNLLAFVMPSLIIANLGAHTFLFWHFFWHSWPLIWVEPINQLPNPLFLLMMMTVVMMMMIIPLGTISLSFSS